MTTNQKNIKCRIELLELAKQLGNVSQACKILGYSRDSFYRYKKLYEAGGEAALADISKKKPIVKNRIAIEIENAIIQMTFEQPTWGQLRISNELNKNNISISPGGVRSVWLRHGLETAKKRLRFLENLATKNDAIHTEDQATALEHAKQKEADCSQIETEQSGHPGFHETFYVGAFEKITKLP